MSIKDILLNEDDFTTLHSDNEYDLSASFSSNSFGFLYSFQNAMSKPFNYSKDIYQRYEYLKSSNKDVYNKIVDDDDIFKVYDRLDSKSIKNIIENSKERILKICEIHNTLMRSIQEETAIALKEEILKEVDKIVKAKGYI